MSPLSRGLSVGCAAAVVAALLAGCSGSSARKPDPYAKQGPFPTALATVPTRVVPSRAPVPIAATGDFGGRVSVKVAKVVSVRSAGVGPGQIAGAAAVSFTFTMRNGSTKPVPLDAVNVAATFSAAATPASPVSGAQTRPFTGTLAAGQSASGVYVFEIPAAQRHTVSVTISYSAAQPTVVFAGTLT